MFLYNRESGKKFYYHIVNSYHNIGNASIEHITFNSNYSNVQNLETDHSIISGRETIHYKSYC